MDKPQVDRIDGIPPAIAIDQVNPVRTSRSTVGTMTELNDHLKLLFARGSKLYCRCCGLPVRRDSADSIFAMMVERAPAAGDPRLAITFPVPVPDNFKPDEVRAMLERQGYTRIEPDGPKRFTVVQDRFRLGSAERARVVEALEAALRVGQGRVDVRVLEESASVASSDATGSAPLASESPATAAPSTPAVWRFSSDLHCAHCDLSYSDPTPSLFSFNSPVGACETCRGFGRVIGVDYGLVVPDESKTLRQGAVKPWQSKSFSESQKELIDYAQKRGIPIDVPWRDLGEANRSWVIDGEPQWKSWNKSFPGTWYGAKRFFDWLETKSYKMHVRVLLSRYRAYTPCTDCDGARLRPDALDWRLGSREDADIALAGTARFRPHAARYDDATLQALPGLTVHDMMLLPAERLRTFFDRLQFPAPLDQATEQLLGEIRARVGYLCQVGLAYLTLDRQSRTLSGGEVQRINLCTALGTSLVNTLFVLDEPSIGLHQRDNTRLLDSLKGLRDLGNSVLVVEHDEEAILTADHVIDMGPAAGVHGGQICAQGTPAEVMASSTSLTGKYLTGEREIELPPEGRRPVDRKRLLKVSGANGNNLRNVTGEIPVGVFTCITGVSGSGKSTFTIETLYKAAARRLNNATDAPAPFDRIEGLEHFDKVVDIDQSPIGRTPRSNPATYTGAFGPIRDWYAGLPEARARGYGPGRFSFNVKGGRCEACQGDGVIKIEMHFLPDVYVTCDVCKGRRYNRETLEIVFRGKSIADVLDMTVEEAARFFTAVPPIRDKMLTLERVGLGYIKVGQQATTLSGGEAQRVKLAKELSRRATGRTLYILDEPTTGLHFEDTRKLLEVLQELVENGNTIVVIEHNLDVIKVADWLLDFGPEGGDGGGEIVAVGTPEDVAANPASWTGRYLGEVLARHDARRKARVAALKKRA
ncbi:MAG: excinuclease ABC subunit UvrA, partial [Brevundimonas sp.]|uniref:excinuclease ABC subunit UvrA n=1 Tax=Brevundimonas sp. TaxID=1871086 RepID=UPI00391F125A